MKVLYCLIVFEPWLGQEVIYSRDSRTNEAKGLVLLEGKWGYILTDRHLELFKEAMQLRKTRHWDLNAPELDSFLDLFRKKLGVEKLAWQLAERGLQLMRCKEYIRAVGSSLKKGSRGAKEGEKLIAKYWQALQIEELLSEGIDSMPETDDEELHCTLHSSEMGLLRALVVHARIRTRVFINLGFRSTDLPDRPRLRLASECWNVSPLSLGAIRPGKSKTTSRAKDSARRCVEVANVTVTVSR